MDGWVMARGRGEEGMEGGREERDGEKEGGGEGGGVTFDLTLNIGTLARRMEKTKR